MSRPRTTRSRKRPTEASGQARPEVTDLLLGWKSDDGKKLPMGFGAPSGALGAAERAAGLAGARVVLAGARRFVREATPQP